RVVGCEDLYFLHRVDIRIAENSTVGARTHGRRAVVRNQALRGASTVDVSVESINADREAVKTGAADTRNQIGHEDRVTAIELECVNLLAVDKLLHRGRFG